MSIAYKIGRSIGRNPKEWVTGGLIAMVMTAGLLSLGTDKEPQSRKDTEAETKALRERLEEEKAKRQAAKLAMCTDGVGKLKEEADAFLKQGKPGPAADVLSACDGLLQDAQAKKMLATAMKAREAEERKAQKAQAAVQAKLQAAEKARKKQEGVTIGMSQQDVLDSSWGKPDRVNRTTTANGVREQWVYGHGNYLYFTNGVLTAYQN
jgi:flavodoxin